jgi:lysophospholipase L1-like esterase
MIAKAQSAVKLKIACIGSDVTYGIGTGNRNQNAYPAQLKKMLGDQCQIFNCGAERTTLMTEGGHAYGQTKEYRTALSINPNIVIIELGGNDAKQANGHYAEFENEYRDLIRSFSRLSTKPRIILLSVIPSFVKDTAQISDETIIKQINLKIQHVAYTEKTEILDMYSPLIDREALFEDQLHPNDQGANLIAKIVYRNLAQARDKKFVVENGIEIWWTLVQNC